VAQIDAVLDERQAVLEEELRAVLAESTNKK
jgi:hypothetical protein